LAPSGHGTGILALLGGRPDSSTPGLIHKATFLVASIFFIDDGEAVTDTVSLLNALNWMSVSDVKLVNMSFSGPQDDLLEARIMKLRSQGVVFAAAAGNEGLAASPSYPAAYPQVIAVTAVDKKLQVYPSANRGVYIDVAAPGVRVWTAIPNSRDGYRSGTSFAVPFVTAVLAIQRSETLRLLKDDLLDQIKTVPLEPRRRSPTYGRGLLQAPGECPNAAEFASNWKPPISSDSPR
jgi:subtilisin family serine protease